MPSINDPAPTALNAALEAGLDVLSLDQTIHFTKYIKVILPYDGFVFWVKADQVSPGALYNAQAYNRAYYNDPTIILSPAATMSVKGSLHYATDTRQEETQTFGRNAVRFTAEEEVEYLNEVSPMVMWLGEWEGLQFGFNTRRSFYRQADIHHYMGDAIYPSMRANIINDPHELNTRSYVISNSLPVWLAMSGPLGVSIWPSYLVSENIAPPFVAVHIGEDDTTPIQGAPLILQNSSHYQLVSDMVRVTTYGLRNDQIMDLLDFVNQYSLDTDIIGIQNIPIPRDTKALQTELNIIAMKKVIEFQVSYYQTRMADVARQLIKSAFISFNPL